MKLFNKKEKKNKNKGTGNDIINQLALQEALRELKAEREKNDSLREDLKIMDKENKEVKELKQNLEIMMNTYDKIKEICKESKTSKIAKAILKELGE